MLWETLVNNSFFFSSKQLLPNIKNQERKSYSDIPCSFHELKVGDSSPPDRAIETSQD